MKSRIKPKNRKWFCQFDTEFYYGSSNEEGKKKLIYKALMETNYAFTELPEGPFHYYKPLKGKNKLLCDFSHMPATCSIVHRFTQAR